MTSRTVFLAVCIGCVTAFTAYAQDSNNQQAPAGTLRPITYAPHPLVVNSPGCANTHSCGGDSGKAPSPYPTHVDSPGCAYTHSCTSGAQTATKTTTAATPGTATPNDTAAPAAAQTAPAGE